VFELTYRLSEPELENLEKFVTSVEDKLQILQEFIQEEMDDVLREYLSVFLANVESRCTKRFSSVTARSPYHGVLTRRFRGSADVHRRGDEPRSTSNTSRLDQWLSSSGISPITEVSVRTSRSIQRSAGRDLFRRERSTVRHVSRRRERARGMVSLHGTEYIVDDIRERRNRSLTSQSVTTRSVIDGSGASILMRLSVHIATPTSRPHKSTASRQLSAR